MNPKQRAYLRAQAHPLKPVVHIGKEGVTEASVRNTFDSFNTRELLKVRVLETAPASVREIGEALAAQLEEAQVVQVIGRIVVLYRPHPEHPQLKLPS